MADEKTVEELTQLLADQKLKTNEFRDNNLALTKEKETLTTNLGKFSGIDTKKYQELLQKETDLADKKLIEAGKIPELVEAKTQERVAAMKGEYTGQIETLTSNLEASTSQAALYKNALDSNTIEVAISKAVLEVGNLKKGALIDVISRAKSTWRVDKDGNPVAMNGDTIVYGKEGKDPITVGEWAQNLAQEAGYLFEGNTGGGAQGSGSFGAGGKTQITTAEWRAAKGKYSKDIASGKIKVVD